MNDYHENVSHVDLNNAATMKPKTNKHSQWDTRISSIGECAWRKFSDSLTYTNIARILILAIFFSLVLISISQCTYRPTQIQGDLVVDRILFKTIGAGNDGQIETPPINALDVKLSNFDSIELKSMSVDGIAQHETEPQSTKIFPQNFPCLDHILIEPDDQNHGLTLDEIQIPGGSNVILELTNSLSQSLKLRIQSEEDNVKPYVVLPANGALKFALIPKNNCDKKWEGIPTVARPARNGLMVIWGSKSKPLEITMLLDPKKLSKIFPQKGVSVSDLKFYKNGPIAEIESSLSGPGTITYPDLPGKEKLDLEENDRLDLTPLSVFRIESIGLRRCSALGNIYSGSLIVNSGPDCWSLRARFAGQAKKFCIRPVGGTSLRDARANLLEQLMASKILIAWGAFCSGVIVLLLTWLQVFPPKNRKAK